VREKEIKRERFTVSTTGNKAKKRCNKMGNGNKGYLRKLAVKKTFGSKPKFAKFQL
jgi:hypothetical protein